MLVGFFSYLSKLNNKKISSFVIIAAQPCRTCMVIFHSAECAVQIGKLKCLVCICYNVCHEWVEKVKSGLMNSWIFTGHDNCDL